MRLDIRFAGIDDQVEQRLRLAGQLLAAYQIRASMSGWDGTKCDVLIADPADGYGSHTMAIAQRRGIPVLALANTPLANTEGIQVLATESPVARLVEAIKGMGQKSSSPKATVRSDTQSLPGIVQLAESSSAAGRDIEARIDDARVAIFVAEGRVQAATQQDIDGACAKVCSSGWKVHPLAASAAPIPAAMVSMSLDVFLLRGVSHSPDSLPAFPDGHYALNHWPDLGSAPDLIDALRVARALRRGCASLSAIIADSELPPKVVLACLWAFQAGGLIERIGDAPSGHDATPTAAAKPAGGGGLLARIAARFGLSRR